MFIGHFAVAFAGKRVAPSVSLGMLLLACQFADLLWPVLVLSGIEVVEIQPGNTVVTPLNFVSYPYSHSLVALLVWAIVIAGGYMLLSRARVMAGLAIGALVLSHWVLDVLSHRPDMPLTIAGATRLGFGLWNSRPATMAVELILFAIGVALYATSTEARDRWGTIGFGTLAGFLLIIYLANMFGPPPPSPAVVAWSGVAMWLLVLWSHWADRHRNPRAALEGV